MSANYEVTATRKRPRSFEELVGQEFVVASLRNSLSAGRIAHAYLFSGPRGVGKTSAARILARALNCPDGPAATGCEEYPGSEEIYRGAAVDVIEIDGASNTSVNDVRQIKDEVLFAPSNAPYKIYIIDEVHMLSNSAFNALLKTIEEPPPYVVFIFATTEIHKVPATIRSRCQQFSFRLIPLDEIQARLRVVVNESDIASDDEALFWIAKESTGSLRDAYTLLDQVISFADGELTLQKIQDKLGLVGIEQLNEIASRIAEGDTKGVIELAHEILSVGVSVEQFTIDLAEYFRSILLLRKGITKEALLGQSPDRFPGRIIKGLSDVQVEHAVEISLSLYRQIRYSLNARFDLELALTRLSSIREYLTHGDILRGLQDLRDGLVTTGESGEAVNPEPVSAPKAASEERVATEEREPPKEPPVTRTGVVAAGSPDDTPPVAERERPVASGALSSETIAAILERVRPTRLALATNLERAISWRLDERELLIVFDSEYPANAAKGEEEDIRTAAAEILGRPVLVRIRVEPGEQSPESEPSESDQVELVKRVFRGQVVEGEQ